MWLAYFVFSGQHRQRASTSVVFLPETEEFSELLRFIQRDFVSPKPERPEWLRPHPVCRNISNHTEVTSWISFPNLDKCKMHVQILPALRLDPNCRIFRKTQRDNFFSWKQSVAGDMMTWSANFKNQEIKTQQSRRMCRQRIKIAWNFTKGPCGNGCRSWQFIQNCPILTQGQSKPNSSVTRAVCAILLLDMQSSRDFSIKRHTHQTLLVLNSLFTPLHQVFILGFGFLQARDKNKERLLASWMSGHNQQLWRTPMGLYKWPIVALSSLQLQMQTCLFITNFCTPDKMRHLHKSKFNRNNAKASLQVQAVRGLLVN